MRKALIGITRPSTGLFFSILLGAIAGACGDDHSKDDPDPASAGRGGAGSGGRKPSTGGTGSARHGGSGGAAAGRGAIGGSGGSETGGTRAVGGAGGEAGSGSGGVAEPEGGSGGDGAAGTGGDGEAGAPATWPKAPALHNPVHLGDLELGTQALKLMGSPALGGSDSCRSCHTLGRTTLTRWLAFTRLPEACLADSRLADQQKTDEVFECLFNAFESSKPYFSAATLGIYSAATHLPWFTFLFDRATGSPDQDMLVRRAGMPRQGTKLSQAEFDVIAEWFARGLPKLEDLIPADPGVPCVPGISEPLKSYVQEHIRSGWRAKNAQDSLLMYGCGQERGAACLANATDTSTLPQGKSWNALPGGHVRLLFDNSGRPTHFWTRASADGRYVASGSVAGEKDSDSAQIVDLQRNTRVPVAALYDPAFFPDNSGFLFMGAPLKKLEEGEGVLTCSQSVLSRSPQRISGSEPECRILASKSIGLYEGVGQSLGGGDYFAASGSFVSDDQGFPDPADPLFQPPANPFAPFDTDSSVNVTPLLNDGRAFVEGTATVVKVPQQGDPILSPSAGLLILRVKGAEKKVPVDPKGKDPALGYVAEQAGYALHLLKANKAGGKLQASIERAGSVCMNGGKPSVSYDERWMILHQYISAENAAELGFSGPDDPKFAPFKQQGGSNLVLVDLLSGAARRITNVSPGEYALYPSFRSDGWIYFVLRSGQDKKEYFLASDAALVLER